MNKGFIKRIAWISLSSGIVTEITMEAFGLGIPWLNGILATVAAAICIYFREKPSKSIVNEPK